MRSRSLTFAALLLLSILPSAVRAQPAFMVKDIGDAVSLDSPLREGFDGASSLELDGVHYFFSDDGIHGTELWRSDGSGAGTRILLDACPGVCSSFPQSLTAFQHKVYWIASDGVRAQLLASDGTPQGTAPAFGPESPAAGRVLSPMGVSGGRLILGGLSDDRSRSELWATDGTAAGLERIRDFPPFPTGVFPSLPSVIGPIGGGALVFSTGDNTTGQTLWATDGTAAGTTSFYEGAPGLLFIGRDTVGLGAVAAGNRLFFEAVNPSKGEAWVSDGTTAGTHALAGVSFDSKLTAVGSQVFFARFASAGWELWKSDGTEAGTVLVRGFSVLSTSPQTMIAVGGRIFFDQSDPSGGRDLWVGDGTEAGTLPVRQFSDLGSFAALGDRLAFLADDGTHGFQPWVSDGTEAGTYLVAEIHGANSGSGLGTLGSLWLFSARDPQGWFLWATDGAPGNLSLVAPLDVQTSSSPVPMASLGGTLLFSATDATSGVGLWRTDGSPSGTFLVESIVPASASFQSPLSPLARIGNQLFFSSGSLLWATDGTAAGTREVPEGSPLEVSQLNATKVGASLYLFGERASQRGLFKTDGTGAGTVLLHAFDLNADFPSALVAAGNRVFFATYRGGSNPSSLWTSDGTVAGTKPIATRHVFNFPRPWLALGSRLLFTELDATGFVLWASDGTEAGTRRLARIDALGGQPGAVASGVGRPAGFLAVVGGRVFFAGDDGVHGRELWVTDGTPAGTGMLADIAPGAEGSSISSLTTVGRRVFFAANDGVHGSELWVSDGTRAGTRLLADIDRGAGSSRPGNLSAIDGLLFFSADDGVHGVEPWVSDGSRAGTRMLQDVAPGPLPSSPSGFLVSGGDVYFKATDATHGFELWAVPWEALADRP